MQFSSMRIHFLPHPFIMLNGQPQNCDDYRSDRCLDRLSPEELDRLSTAGRNSVGNGKVAEWSLQGGMHVFPVQNCEETRGDRGASLQPSKDFGRRERKRLLAFLNFDNC